MRRRAYRALADLRGEFQRTLSEPPAVSQRATLWWPAVAALEEVMDAVTAAAVAADHGATPPTPERLRALIAVLHGIADAVRGGVPPPQPAHLNTEENPGPIADAVRRVQAALS